jgi:hypothetical protein
MAGWLRAIVQGVPHSLLDFAGGPRGAPFGPSPQWVRYLKLGAAGQCTALYVSSSRGGEQGRLSGRVARAESNSSMFCCAAPQRQSSGGKPKPGPRIEERGRSPSPQDLRPLRLELEPEPEPEPAPAQQPQHRSPLQPAPGSPLEPEGEAAANELPEPYSGPFTPGRHCMRYVRLLLAHVVFSLVLGALASRRGTFFSGRFPYSQPRDSEEASHGEKGAALMSDVWAWALSRVGLFAGACLGPPTRPLKRLGLCATVVP